LVDYADGYKVFVDEPEKVNVRINGIKEDNKDKIEESDKEVLINFINENYKVDKKSIIVQ